MSNTQGDDNEGANHERWLVSYADFITLLFAFFTVLYATSNRDLEKTQKFQESVKRFLIKTGAFGESGQKINQGEKYNSPIEQPIPTYNQTLNSPATQETFKETENYLDEILSSAEKDKYIYDIQVDELGVRITVSGALLFAPNSAKFREDALPVMKKLGAFFSRVGRRVIVEGHSQTISNPVYPSAWEFASARATALVRYFIKVHKMTADRFVPISYGDQRPVVQAQRSEKNERIEFVIVTEDIAL